MRSRGAWASCMAMQSWYGSSKRESRPSWGAGGSRAAPASLRWQKRVRRPASFFRSRLMSSPRRLAISSAGAKKYGKETAQVRWAHLNMKMKSSLPSGVKGFVAELAGLQSLTQETKSYLTVPKIVADLRMRRKRALKGEMKKQEASALQA